MGLDTVEIVLITESIFSITVEDTEAAQVETAGHLFELICSKLNLPLAPTRPLGTGHPAPINRIQVVPRLKPWNHEDVWATIVAIFVDQMQLDPEEIRCDARINADLGID